MSERQPNDESIEKDNTGKVAAIALAAAVGTVGGIEAIDQVGLYQIEHNPAYAAAHEVPGSVHVAKLSDQEKSDMLALMSSAKLTRVPTATELDLYDTFKGTPMWDEFVKVMQDHPLLIEEAYEIGKKIDPDFSIIK
jgi:hypothetical protein